MMQTAHLHTITNLRALKPLLLLLILCSLSTQAWAGKQTFWGKAEVKSEPSIGGYVYVTKSKQTESTTIAKDKGKTTDSSTQSYENSWATVWGVDVGKMSSRDFDFYGYQDAKTGFDFKGWTTTASDNSGSTSTSNHWSWGTNYPYHGFSITATSTTESNPTKVTYYAIFAGIVSTFNTPTANLNFGDVNVGESKEMTLIFKHAHAGKISKAFSGTNSGDFKLKDGTTLPQSSTTLANCTITVVFTPSCESARSATLTLTGNNGGSMTVSLSGTGKLNTPNFSTTNGSVDVSIGSTITTDLNDRVTCDNTEERTYTCANAAATISNKHFFSATKAGDYTVNVSIAKSCEYTAASGSFTITVNRVAPTLELSETTGTVDRTTDVEHPNYFDFEPIITYVGDGYNYTITSANSATGYFDGDKFYATEAGIYTIHVSSPESDRYSNTFSDGQTYREAVVTVRDKAHPLFAKNFTQDVANALLVDGSIENAFTIENVSVDKDFACNITCVINAINNGNDSVISYDIKSNTITAHNAGTATLQFVQTENEDYYGGSSDVYTFKVSKYQTSFSGSDNNDLLVEVPQTADYSYTNTSKQRPTADSNDDFYYTIDDIVFDSVELNKGTNLVTFTPSNKQITPCNAGTGKITFHQRETYKVTGAEQSFNVKVDKNPNAVKVNGNADFYTEKYFDEGEWLTFSSLNTNNPTAAYTVEQTSGSQYATYYNDGRYIWTAPKPGTAQWTVTQEEDYKFASASTTMTVKVKAADPATNCYVLVENGWDERGLLSRNSSTAESFKESSMELRGTGDVLTFQMERRGLGGSAKFRRSIDGKTWSDSIISESSGSYQLHTINLSSDIRYIKFSGNGTDDPYIKDIKVTRKTWLEVPAISITKQEDGRTLIVPTKYGKGILTISYSVASGGPLKIYCDNNKFSFTEGKITESLELPTTDCSADTLYIPVYFLSDEPGEEVAHVVVFNKVYRAETTITGFTQNAATPMLIWNIGSNLDAKSTYGKFVESTDKETPMTIETNPAALLTVSGDMASGYVLTVGNVGTITDGSITVTQGELNETLAVKINPRSDACLPYIPADNEDFRKARAGSGGNVSWCSAEGDSTHNHILPALGLGWIPNAENIDIDVTYSQEIGIALGTYLEGLEDLKNGFVNWWEQSEFKYTPKYVDLAFSGIPDNISFEAKVQTVTSRMNGGLPVSWPATITTWKLYESADKASLGKGDPIKEFNSIDTTITCDLQATTRYVRIEYGGNFTGYVIGLNISRKKRFAVVDKDNAYISKLVFGTEEKPLQAPQTIYLSYSSLNSCGENLPIKIVSKDEAFYVDDTLITANVGINQTEAKYTINVRCTDVAKRDKELKFMLGEEELGSISLESEEPAITSEGTSIFQTGTEYGVVDDTYRGSTTHSFAACFNDEDDARFDTLYIYGISASAPNTRDWISGFKVPKIVLKDGNVHTPCFVYAKNPENNKEYVHERTYDAATTTLNVSASDKKLAFMGYKPASMKGTAIPAAQLSGTHTEIYLNNTEMHAKGAVLALNGIDTIFARGTNTLTSAADATIKLISLPSKLVVKDNWLTESSGFVALNAPAGKPSIELNNANDSVFIEGSQLQLHNNANRMAIACAEDIHKGFVHIYDGTITGDDTLGLPLKSLIDGGTFNQGPVYVYRKGKLVRPWNSRGELLAHDTVNSIGALPTWYGKSYLKPVASNYYPMLLDDNVCIFNGSESSSADEPGNWNKEPKPGCDVIIDSAIVISEPMVVNTIFIREQEGKDVSVTIAPTGGLTVGEGGIIGATKDNLILKADSVAKSETKGQTGFLRIDPECEEPMPQATIQLFSIGYYNKKNNSNGGARQNAQWQYVGSPLSSDKIEAASVFTISKIYNWDEEGNTWVNNKTNLKLKPWEGYATTQTKHKDGCLITFAGELVANKSITIPLTSAGSGENMLANSFSAPIDVTKLLPGDFQNTQGTIYIFNTGTYNEALSHQEQNAQNQNTRQVQNYYEAGQLIPIAVGSAKKMAEQFADDKLPKTIAPMQGFSISVDQKGKPASVTFDYSRVVYSATNPNTILRAPKKVTADDEDMPITGTLKLTMQSENWSDRVYMLESEQYSVDYENGYDAPKSESGMSEVFVCTDDKELAINATSSIIGTRIGVRTSDEINYSFHFSYVRAEDDLALLDTETNMTTDIDEGTEYTFYAEPNSEILGRFQIVGRAKAPSTPTGVNEVESDNKVHKFIKDNQLYILKNGVLYNGMGAVVR